MVSPRDAEIVRLVGRFGQLASGHVQALLFDDLSSTTPCKRALARLTDNKMLARIERRMIGGYKGGSGQYAYQLGSKGWQFLGREGRYWPYRAISHHMLAVADVFVALVDAQRKGALEIVALSTEPDTWQTIAGAELRPDMFVELALKRRRVNVTLWLEVDLGTERQKQIKDKLARYWHVYEHATSDDLDTFPLVLFLVPDEARASEVRYMIDRGKSDARALFSVTTLDEFPSVLL